MLLQMAARVMEVDRIADVAGASEPPIQLAKPEQGDSTMEVDETVPLDMEGDGGMVI